MFHGSPSVTDGTEEPFIVRQVSPLSCAGLHLTAYATLDQSSVSS